MKRKEVGEGRWEPDCERLPIPPVLRDPRVPGLRSQLDNPSWLSAFWKKQRESFPQLTHPTLV